MKVVNFLSLLAPKLEAITMGHHLTRKSQIYWFCSNLNREHRGWMQLVLLSVRLANTTLFKLTEHIPNAKFRPRLNDVKWVYEALDDFVGTCAEGDVDQVAVGHLLQALIRSNPYGAKPSQRALRAIRMGLSSSDRTISYSAFMAMNSVKICFTDSDLAPILQCQPDSAFLLMGRVARNHLVKLGGTYILVGAFLAGLNGWQLQIYEDLCIFIEIFWTLPESVRASRTAHDQFRGVLKRVVDADGSGWVSLTDDEGLQETDTKILILTVLLKLWGQQLSKSRGPNHKFKELIQLTMALSTTEDEMMWSDFACYERFAELLDKHFQESSSVHIGSSYLPMVKEMVEKIKTIFRFGEPGHHLAQILRKKEPERFISLKEWVEEKFNANL
ncbi:hypothetical protein C8R44DRAFT_147479 [Mycena epipterygia]|nr:hypothetical protein C8R44DRAFT_147479 [Mycena epipterygia]